MTTRLRFRARPARPAAAPNYLASAVLLLLVAGGGGAEAQDAVRTIQAEQIRAHLAFLADDALEGRAPGRRGARIAARYIVSQLARAGVEPVGTSYYHPIPLTGWHADARRTAVEYAVGDSTGRLSFPDDVIVWLDSGADTTRVRSEIIFAGYGVRAPEYEWNDYKDRDVRGRIVLVLSSDPPAPPDQPLIFEGGAMSYYGRYTYKIEEARRQGAA
ncbi:MAG: hypothetical protein ACREK1_09020, partial [Longimicrobiales bacterium]